MSRASCSLALPWVAASAAGDTAVGWPARAHVSVCLRCQARLSYLRRIQRELSRMGEIRMPAPPGLEWQVMSSLNAIPGRGARRFRPTAAAAALISVVAAVILLRMRARVTA